MSSIWPHVSPGPRVLELCFPPKTSQRGNSINDQNGRLPLNVGMYHFSPPGGVGGCTSSLHDEYLSEMPLLLCLLLLLVRRLYIIFPPCVRTSSAHNIAVVLVVTFNAQVKTDQRQVTESSLWQSRSKWDPKKKFVAIASQRTTSLTGLSWVRLL